MSNKLILSISLAGIIGSCLGVLVLSIINNDYRKTLTVFSEKFDQFASGQNLLREDVRSLQDRLDKLEGEVEQISWGQSSTKTPSVEDPPHKERTFVILAINDVYRIEGVDEGTRGGLARVRHLRTELEQTYPDLLLLHAGDLLFPSLLSRLYDGAQMVDVLNRLDGDPYAFDARMLVTFGNHEFDKSELEDAVMLERRIEESQFRWLHSNINFTSGDDTHPLIEAKNLINHAIVTSGGVKVGVFSLTTDYKRPAYVTRFGKPEATARRMSAWLRQQGAEVIVALTHLPIEEEDAARRSEADVALLHNLGSEGPDLIIGGHEHHRQHRKVNDRWVIKADADARTATIVWVSLPVSGPPHVSFEFRELSDFPERGPKVPEDPEIKAHVQRWLTRHDMQYCHRKDPKLDPGCLSKRLSKTLVDLGGEELEIRKYETNLGNWIADIATVALAEEGAQAAFINSGSLRLNQDILAGTELTQRHVEEIFAYPAHLWLLRIKGQTLQEVISRAVQNWKGEGHWLQISGFAYRHDPVTKNADRLTLLTSGRPPRPIKPDEDLCVVTIDFLVNPEDGQDGYTMLKRGPNAKEVRDKHKDEPVSLKDLVIQALEKSGPEGIAPQVEGRICNTTKPGLCLAVATDDMSQAPSVSNDTTTPTPCGNLPGTEP